MGKVPRIPLEERLRCMESAEPDFLASFELFVDDFYEAAAGMEKEETLWKLYEDRVQRYNCRDGKDKRLSEMAAIAGGLPEREKAALLYDILVEPFAALERERRKQDGLEFFHAGDYPGDEQRDGKALHPGRDVPEKGD